MFKTVLIFGQLPYPAAKMSVLLKLCTKYINICCGTKCSTGEENNLDVIWIHVECSVKRVEHCTIIGRILTVLLPVMYIRNINICVSDQQMHTANIWLSYISNSMFRSLLRSSSGSEPRGLFTYTWTWKRVYGSFSLF